MVARLRNLVHVSTCAVLAVLAGCGAKPVPTRGTVHVAGKPLANATVMFIADDPAGKNATGITNAEGVFLLKTEQQSGAMPGSYKITIVHSEPVEIPKGLKTPEEIMEASANAVRRPSVVPEIYQRPDQTPLKHRVPQDGDAKFELKKAQ